MKRKSEELSRQLGSLSEVESDLATFGHVVPSLDWDSEEGRLTIILHKNWEILRKCVSCTCRSVWRVRYFAATICLPYVPPEQSSLPPLQQVPAAYYLNHVRSA